MGHPISQRRFPPYVVLQGRRFEEAIMNEPTPRSKAKILVDGGDPQFVAEYKSTLKQSA